MVDDSNYLKQFDFHDVKHLLNINILTCILSSIFLFLNLWISGSLILEDLSPVFFLIISLFSIIFLFSGKTQLAKFFTIFLLPLSIFSNLIHGDVPGFYFILAPIALIGLASLPYLVSDFRQEKPKIIIASIYYLLLIIFSEWILKLRENGTDNEMLTLFFNNLFAIKTTQIAVFSFYIYLLYQLVNKNEEYQSELINVNQDLKIERLKLLETISELKSQNKAINGLIDLMITDRTGLISYANKQFCRNTKYTIEEITGKNPRVFDSGHHSDDFFKELWKTILSGKVWSGQIKNKRKDGSVYWVQSIITPMHSGGHNITGFLSLMFDITTLKENERKLAELNKTKDNVIATVSHDLKTPINNIKYLSEIIYHSKVNDNEKNKIYELIINSCDQSNKLLGELLEVYELEDNTNKLEKQITNLNEFIIQTLNPFKEVIKQSNLKLELQLSEKTVHVELNQEKFVRVINNLISNSIKYTPIKGIISVKTYFIENGKVRIEIADTGIGIPKKLQPILFDKFTKASRIGLKNEKSTGLGMSIVKQIIELHGGSISLKSKEGFGTTFFLDLVKI